MTKYKTRPVMLKATMSWNNITNMGTPAIHPVMVKQVKTMMIATDADIALVFFM